MWPTHHDWVKYLKWTWRFLTTLKQSHVSLEKTHCSTVVQCCLRATFRLAILWKEFLFSVFPFEMTCIITRWGCWVFSVFFFFFFFFLPNYVRILNNFSLFPFLIIMVQCCFKLTKRKRVAHSNILLLVLYLKPTGFGTVCFPQGRVVLHFAQFITVLLQGNTPQKVPPKKYWFIFLIFYIVLIRSILWPKKISQTFFSPTGIILRTIEGWKCYSSVFDSLVFYLTEVCAS